MLTTGWEECDCKHCDVLIVELERRDAKLIRLRSEARVQQSARDFSNRIRLAQAAGRAEPCQVCNAPSKVMLRTRRDIHYWCYAHADEHWAYRIHNIDQRQFKQWVADADAMLGIELIP